MLSKLRLLGQKLYLLRFPCFAGLISSIVAFCWLLFFATPEQDKWLLPTATSFGWFACLYALLNFSLLLPEPSSGKLNWWNRFKLRCKTFMAWIVLLVFLALSLTLVFISFRAIGLFFS